MMLKHPFSYHEMFVNLKYSIGDSYDLHLINHFQKLLKFVRRILKYSVEAA